MATLDLQPKLMIGEGWGEFALIDSGHGRKLESYGPYRSRRPAGGDWRVGAGGGRLASGRVVRAGVGRGWRRALAIPHGGPPRGLAAVPRRGALHRELHAFPAPRLLS